MMIQNQARYKDYPQIETGEVNIAVVGGGPACKFLITFLETHTLRHIQIISKADAGTKVTIELPLELI